MTELKTPDWIAFPLQKEIPEFNLPHRQEILQYLNHFQKNLSQASLESIFWYLTIKYYFQIIIDDVDNTQIYSRLLKCEVVQSDFIGFASMSRDEYYLLEKKQRKEVGEYSPDLFSTFSALASLNYLGRLNEYYRGFDQEDRKKEIISFFTNLKSKKGFLHCLDSKCKLCKSIDPNILTFYGLMLAQILGVRPKSLLAEIFPLLKSSKKLPSQTYVFLVQNFLGVKEGITDADLLKFHELQSAEGGFCFEKDCKPTIEDSFWIINLLSAYRWLLPYRSGQVYSYIVASLHQQELYLGDEPTTLRSLGQLVVMTALIWDNLVDEIEDLLFTSFSVSPVLDLSLLSIRGGVKGAEEEVIAYINQKYRLTLEILENEIMFRRYLNKLTPLKKKLTEDLHDLVRNNRQVDISEFTKGYNKGKRKNNRIKDSLLLEILKELIEEHFFTGNVVKKSKMFGSIYYFIRESFIDKVIISNRSGFSIDDIKREKRHLEDVKNDIFNMTREMEKASDNIMYEVESLIIVGEVSLAEERMRSNIKKALFDASFFNKNIEAFQEEFEYLRGKFLLQSLVRKWDSTYSSLQQTFTNIKRILTVKIEELKEEQEQHNLTLALEEKINSSISLMMDEFNEYQESFRLLESNYSREKVHHSESELHRIQKLLDNKDQDISKISHSIQPKKEDVAKLRKKVINRWISQLEEFHNAIDYYSDGFKFWSEKIGEIDRNHNSLVQNIELTSQKINQFIKNEEHEKALNINQKEFPHILEDIQKFSEKLKSDLEKRLSKNRKLFPLFHSIETEWLLYQNVLEKLSQKIRSELQNSIELDLKIHQQEKFKLDVDAEITYLRNELIEFEKHVHSTLRKDGQMPDFDFHNGVKQITSLLEQKSKQITKNYDHLVKDYPDLDPNTSNFHDKWAEFVDAFQKELNGIKNKFQDEELIQTIFNYAKQHKSNYITLFVLAKLMKVEESALESRLLVLIDDARINAVVLDEDPKKIELHNEDWRKWKRLKQYLTVTFRELDAHYYKIYRFYERSIFKHDFIKNIKQIRSLITNFKQKIFHNFEEYEVFLQNHQIDPENELVIESHKDFVDKTDVLKQNINKMTLSCDRTEQFQDFLLQQEHLLEDSINSEIHRLYTELQRRKLSKYRKNLKWFRDQKHALESGIEQIDKNVDTFKEKNYNDIGQTISIIVDLEQEFKEKKLELMDTFSNASNDILEKLSFNELNNMRQEMEDLIQEKQTILNKHLKKADIDIKNKIRIKDFGGASKRLLDKSEFLEGELKVMEKEIKAKNKQFSQNKIFGIKYHYLVEQWELFLLDFLNAIRGQEIQLEEELIQSYLMVIINALKENYIPLNKIAHDLEMRHDLVQHRLISLIGDKKVSGKINMTYDIYFEGDEELEEDIIASLDIIRHTNVKTYIWLKRMKNVFAYVAPVITGVLSLSAYVSEFSSSPFVIGAPIVIAAILFLLIWLYQGRQKAIKMKLLPKKSKAKPSYMP